MKRCSRCGEEKPLDHFYWVRPRGHNPYRNSRCKPCYIAISTARILATKPWKRPGAAERKAVYDRDRRARLAPRIKAKKKAYVQANLLQVTIAHFGLSVADYNAMLAAQGGRCAICGDPPDERRLAVDHDHSDGRVRGLLCKPCNGRLGAYHDDADELLRAVRTGGNYTCHPRWFGRALAYLDGALAA